MSREEYLPPNYKRLDAALRSIGYSFQAAVADVIDNSVDAMASKVLVRLITREDGYLDLVIWDDGSGMDRETLQEAMRFGANVSQEVDRLGKFGLGLKLASLSQARELHVFSVKDGLLSGRAWLEHGIKTGFSSIVYDPDECNQVVSDIVPDCEMKTHGTAIWWSHLYRVGQHHGHPEESAQRLLNRLNDHLSLAFHRFLAGRPRSVKLALDIFERKTKRSGIPRDLEALDPFGYDFSGSPIFPADMFLEGYFKDRIAIKAHIWPPKTTSSSYRLPGGANSRQGFYFYRNNRLIQGGGWNGIREAEPHSSLARLEVDISPDFDVEVSLDVKKVEIQLPPGLVLSIQKARTSFGTDFKRYLSIAEEAYRGRKISETELPLIPSHGLPSPLSKFLHNELRIEATAKHRELIIKWKRLSIDEFFEIDREAGHLFLNQEFRTQLLHGLWGSSADIPVVKCLLFLLLEDVLGSERMGAKMRERIEQVNRILVKAVQYERTS
jgi:hypothetical protein